MRKILLTLLCIFTFAQSKEIQIIAPSRDNLLEDTEDPDQHRMIMALSERLIATFPTKETFTESQRELEEMAKKATEYALKIDLNQNEQWWKWYLLDHKQQRKNLKEFLEDGKTVGTSHVYTITDYQSNLVWQPDLFNVEETDSTIKFFILNPLLKMSLYEKDNESNESDNESSMSVHKPWFLYVKTAETNYQEVITNKFKSYNPNLNEKDLSEIINTIMDLQKTDKAMREDLSKREKIQSSDPQEKMQLNISLEQDIISLRSRIYFMRSQNTVFTIQFSDYAIGIGLLKRVDIPSAIPDEGNYIIYLVPEMNNIPNAQTTLANTRYKGLLVEDRNKQGFHTSYGCGYTGYFYEKGADDYEYELKNDVGNYMRPCLDLFPASAILACFNQPEPMPSLSKRDYIVIEAIPQPMACGESQIM